MKKLEELGISHAPWKCESVFVFNCDVSVALTISQSDDESVSNEELANARLIAAAPELYEQLRDAVRDQCNDCDHRDDDFKCHNGCYCKIWKWRAALSNAAGEEVK